MKNHELLKLVQQNSYIGIFFWFAFIQLLFPIPQEIALISIGYFSMHIHIHLLFSILIATAGTVTSDMLLFYLTKKGSKITKSIIKRINKKWLHKTEGKLDKNTIYTLFILLLLPEARTIAPVLGAVAGMPAKKFLLLNFVANIILCTVYSLLGRFFYSGLAKFGSKLDGYKHFIFIGVMLIGSVLIILFIRKKIFHAK